MASYTFEREARTSYSECYTIEGEDGTVGRVDLHFTSGPVHATLCLGEDLTEEEIQELINTIDERIVVSADPIREDFIVTVWVGRAGGVYSDLDEDEEDEEELGEEDEDDVEHNGARP